MTHTILHAVSNEAFLVHPVAHVQAATHAPATVKPVTVSNYPAGRMRRSRALRGLSLAIGLPATNRKCSETMFAPVSYPTRPQGHHGPHLSNMMDKERHER